METTEIVFILDRSGSMYGLEDDTIGSYNALIEKQRKEKGKAYITTVLFDSEMTVLYENQDIEKVKPLTRKEYDVKGCTALLDAVGLSMKAMKARQKQRKADHVIFVINTDGYENASCIYDYQKINKMITKAKSKHHWQFIFLGAKIDAIQEARQLGIDQDHAVSYINDSQGIEACYQSTNAFICKLRNHKPTTKWKNHVENDNCIKR